MDYKNIDKKFKRNKKPIEFENICLHVEYLVFIYRSENQIFYCVIHNYKKIAKYVFFIVHYQPFF